MKYAPMDHEMWPHRAEITIIGGGLAGIFIFIFTFSRTFRFQVHRLPTGSSSVSETRTSRWSSSKTTTISWKVVRLLKTQTCKNSQKIVGLFKRRKEDMLFYSLNMTQYYFCGSSFEKYEKM